MKRAVVECLCARIALYGSFDASRDEIATGLRNYLEWLEGMFKEAGRMETLEEESKETERRIFEIQQGAKRNRRKKLRKQTVKQKQVDKELDALEKSDTGQFLRSLRGVVGDLLCKSQRVFRYRDAYVGPGAHVRRIKEIKLAIASERVEKTEFTPFGISLILEPNYYREINTYTERSVGMHFPNTPFNLISGAGEEGKERSEEDVRGTVWHEQKHNLLEGMSNIHSSKSLEALKRSIAEGSLKKLKVKTLLNNLHEEIIAASEQAERIWKSGVGEGFYALRTAGREVEKMLASLVEEKANAKKLGKDLDWKIALVDIEKDIRREFEKIIWHMKVSLGITGEIGEEATRGVHILFVLLRPSQYRHILSYLKYKYGEKKVDKILKKIKIV